MAAHGLQRVAEAGLLVTVVDDQGGEQRSLARLAKLAHERLAAGLVSRMASSGAACGRCRSSSSAPPSVKAKPPWPSLAINRSRQASPRRMNCRMGSASTNSLAMTISGPSGTRVERRIPAKRCARILEGPALRLAMTGLVSINATETAVEKFRNAAPGAGSIGHQSAAPRSELGDRHPRRLAHVLPDRDRPEADRARRRSG